jgi:predicted transcriptional regulator
MTCQELDDVRAALLRGEDPKTTVRDFLWWFYAQRRGHWIVRSIRRALAERSLRTIPNFEHAWIDATIRFERTDLESTTEEEVEEAGEPQDDSVEQAVSGLETAEPVWVSREAAYRISRLAAANQEIVSVKPDDLVPQIITKMMAGGYSQLPVMTNERTVKGIVSWQSIGIRLAMGVSGQTASQLSEAHHEISDERSIFDAIPIVVAHDYVLIRDSTNRISGIITASDLSLQFRELTEPFLLLSEIENLVRNLIGQHFTPDELKSACESADTSRLDKVETVADLNFGEYIRLLQNPERWSKIGLSIDRVAFCLSLDRVREIRNDVMHFDPDGITNDDLKALRDLTRFLQQLAMVTGKYSV